ncbi:uncharacterized protein BJX67DRAFT_62372 [Aspergillus lucknowensis]|uniref:Uncharacterized protein n=1 Tax=Aspergillus lucknowensis TaxID=176173 RepID=A0ABR4LUB1_9EURO
MVNGLSALGKPGSQDEYASLLPISASMTFSKPPIQFIQRIAASSGNKVLFPPFCAVELHRFNKIEQLPSAGSVSHKFCRAFSLDRGGLNNRFVNCFLVSSPPSCIMICPQVPPRGLDIPGIRLEPDGSNVHRDLELLAAPQPALFAIWSLFMIASHEKPTDCTMQKYSLGARFISKPVDAK